MAAVLALVVAALSAAEIRNLIGLLVARQEAIMLGDLKRAAGLGDRSSGRPVKPNVPCATCGPELHLSNWVDPLRENALCEAAKIR